MLEATDARVYAIYHTRQMQALGPTAVGHNRKEQGQSWTLSSQADRGRQQLRPPHQWCR
jgi:hypothetical protein